MSELKTENGGRLILESLPEDEDALFEAVAEVQVVLDPLPDDAADVDPATFASEIQSYVKEVYRLKFVPKVEFRLAGCVDEAVLWVFESAPRDRPPLYVALARNIPFAEVVCCEKRVSWTDRKTGEARQADLTPAQAALLLWGLGETP